MDFILPVYNVTKKIIDRHVDNFKKLEPSIAKYTRVIVIDDGSNPEFPVETDFGIKTKIARIDEDIIWHAEGAINLGFLLAEDSWCVLLNVDHIMPADDICRATLMKNRTREKIYIFDRYLPNGKSRNKNVTGVSMIHRDDWWRIGGYDEEFCGGHGCADWLATGFAYKNPPLSNNLSVAKALNFELIQTDLKVIEYKDAEAPLKRDSLDRNMKIYKTKLKALSEGKYRNTHIIGFDWRLVRDDSYEQ